MKKLITTLILGLGLSGAAFADEGYFADHAGDFSNAPVQAGQSYDGQGVRAHDRSPEPVAVMSQAPFADVLVLDWSDARPASDS